MYIDYMFFIKKIEFFFRKFLILEISRKDGIIIKNFFCFRLLYFINLFIKRYFIFFKLDEFISSLVGSLDIRSKKYSFYYLFFVSWDYVGF